VLPLQKQYQDSSNLSARQRIYRFATSQAPLGQFIFERMNLSNGAGVLELGCGHGSFWSNQRDWIARNWKLVLTDLSQGMLLEAQQRLRTLGDVKLLRADAQQIPFADKSFDAVLASHMLYHVPDRQAAFRQVRRVLRDGGTFYAITNALSHLRELKKLIESFVPGCVSVMENGGSIDWFCLETGGDQMAPHFESVNMERRPGELRVTDAQAVVDYAWSIDRVKAELPRQGLEQLRRQVQHEIDRHGAFVIHTEVGMFTAC
jgi:SAM-dependent methyltransferase